MIHHEMNIATVATPIATMIQNGLVVRLVVIISKVVLIRIIMNLKLPLLSRVSHRVCLQIR